MSQNIVLCRMISLNEELGRVDDLLLIKLSSRITLLLIRRLNVQAKIHGNGLNFRCRQTNLLFERQCRTERTRLHQYIRFLQTRRLYQLEFAIVVNNDASQAAIPETKVYEVLARDEFI